MVNKVALSNSIQKRTIINDVSYSQLYLNEVAFNNTGYYSCAINNVLLNDSLGQRYLVNKNASFFLQVQCKLFTSFFQETCLKLIIYFAHFVFKTHRSLKPFDEMCTQTITIKQNCHARPSQIRKQLSHGIMATESLFPIISTTFPAPW